MQHKRAYKLHKNPEYANRKGRKGANRAAQTEPVYTDKTGTPVTRKLIYENLEEGYSRGPKEKFCDVTGFEGRNTHAKSELFFHNRLVYKHIRKITQAQREEYRSIRNLKRLY